jgi:hypothetical protein
LRGVEKETEQKLPKWENDFWSYIAQGNGVHCPLYNFCKVRQRGGWCPDEHSHNFIQLFEEDGNSLNRCYEFQNYIDGMMFSSIEMLARKYLTMGRVVSPPVSVDIIYLADEYHNIEIRYLPLKNIHGALWYWNDEWILQLNKNDSWGKMRFTLFHEAFHILTSCHTSLVPFKNNNGRERFNELLADQFAMCILMPRKWIFKKWVDTDSPMEIAQIFEVPEHLATLRLNYLHLV